MPSPSSARVRSLSLSGPLRTLGPSPDIRNATRDDNVLARPPSTPRKHDMVVGLSLQMPSTLGTDSISILRPLLSPHARDSSTYSQHITSLPRHSRGLDFSRACTNLHHSTLAESSPDSSPVVVHKHGSLPNYRSSVVSATSDPTMHSSAIATAMPWSSLPGTQHDRSTWNVSTHPNPPLSSVSSDSEDDTRMHDHDDGIYTTPQVYKIGKPAVNNVYTSQHASNHMATALVTPVSPMHSVEFTNPHFGRPRQFARNASENSVLGIQVSPTDETATETSPLLPAHSTVIKRAVTRRGNLLPKTKGFARIKAALQEEGAPVDSEERREAETIRQVRERDGDHYDFRRQSSHTSGSSPSLAPTTACTDNMLDDIDDSTNMLLDPISLEKPLHSADRHASRNRGSVDFWHRFDKNIRTPPPALSSCNSTDSGFPSESNADACTASSTEASQRLNNVQPPTQFSSATRKFGKRARGGDDDLDISSIKRRAVSPSLSSVQNSPVAPTHARTLSHGPILSLSRSNSQASGQGTIQTTSQWPAPSQSQSADQTQCLSPRAQKDTPRSIQHHHDDQQSGLPPLRRESTDYADGYASPKTFKSASIQDEGSVTRQTTPIPTSAPGTKRIGLQGMTDTSDGFMKMSID